MRSDPMGDTHNNGHFNKILVLCATRRVSSALLAEGYVHAETISIKRPTGLTPKRSAEIGSI